MFQKKSGLSVAVTALLIVVVIIAAALSFTVGRDAGRPVTVTQTLADLFTVTTTQVSFSTVMVTTTPPNYFQVNGVTLFSGTASTKTSQGTASIQFSVTGPITTASTTTAAIIVINISNTNSTSYPAIYQCTSSTSCIVMSDAVVRRSGVTYFNTPSTAFYIGTRIISGQSYDYNIIFSNGDSVAGTIVAQ